MFKSPKYFLRFMQSLNCNLLWNQTEKANHILLTYRGTGLILLFQNVGEGPQWGNTRKKKKTKNQLVKPLNSISLCLMQKYSSVLQLLSSFLATTNFFLFGSFHSQLAAFLGKCPKAMTSPASWAIQGNFNFKQSCPSVWDPHSDVLSCSKGLRILLQLWTL